MAADESASVAAVPDGMTVAQAMAELQLGKTALYQRMRLLGIQPVTHGGRAYLSGEQMESLRNYSKYGKAAALVRHPTAALLAMAASAGQQAEPDGAHSANGEQDERERLELLQLRLRVLREAVELGGPLTTAEVALLLGARPGGNEVIRGRVAAVREGRDCWTLERLEVEPG